MLECSNMFNNPVYEIDEIQISNNLRELGSNNEFGGLLGGSTIRFLSDSNELELIAPENNKNKRSSKHVSTQADHRDISIITYKLQSDFRGCRNRNVLLVVLTVLVTTIVILLGVVMAYATGALKGLITNSNIFCYLFTIKDQ